MAKYDRKALHERLRLLRPALADKSPLPGLTHMWFDGEWVMAYNDIIGAAVQYAVKINGGIMGTVLLGLLEASNAENADISPDLSGTAILLKLAGAKAKLSLLDKEHLTFGPPGVDNDPVVVFDAEFITAVKRVMISVPTGAIATDNTGVTVMPEGKMLAFYASDGRTISWARVPLPKGYAAKRVVMSTLFCDQLLTTCAKGGTLYIAEDHVVAYNDTSTVMLWGKMIEVAKALDYSAMINANMPEAEAPALPEILPLCLDRAAVLAGSAGATKLIVSVDGTSMHLFSKTDVGELDETLTLEIVHEKTSGPFDGPSIKRGLAQSDCFLMTENAFIMLLSGCDCGYMVAAIAD